MTFIPNDTTWTDNPTSRDFFLRPKTYQDCSLFQGSWPFDVPNETWRINEGGSYLIINETSTNVTSENGRLQVDSGTTASDNTFIKSRRSPRFQHNRGHIFSTFLGMPNKTNNGRREFGMFTDEEGVFYRLKSDGNLYACVRRNSSDINEEVITLPASFDVERGNAYNIQYSTGAFKFYVEDPGDGKMKLVKTIGFGNILDEELAVRNLSLPVRFECTNITQEVRIWSACVDISSEGGEGTNKVYGSISTDPAGVSLPTSAEYDLIAIRVNETFNSKINTRDIELRRIITSCNNESIIGIYFTRDSSVFTGTTWTQFKGRDNIEYAIGGNLVTNLSSTNLLRLVTSRAEQDFKNEFDNPGNGVSPFHITAGEYVLVTFDASSGNTAWATIEFLEEM